MEYDWIRAFHLIAVISWMAGLLYLPRLFVYHSMAEVGGAQALTFKLMERRLLKIIMNPAMIVSWFLGLWMLHLNTDLLFMPWMWVKLTCVILMTGLHMVFSRMRRQLENDAPPYKDRTYRIWNEVPVVFMVIIIIMAVVEPF